MNNESAANLETSRSQTQQANSEPANKQQQQNSNGAPIEKPAPLSLQELFADDNSEDGESPNQEDDPSKPIDSLDTLLRRTKMKPEDAYKIKIPMPNGAQPLTLGELKDRVGELVGHEQNVLQFDTRRVEQEGTLLRAQAEMRDLIALLPKEAIKPELVKKVREQTQAQLTRETELTLEHIPSWQDPVVANKELGEMKVYLRRWGFQDAFIDTVRDHRAVKFIRDSYLRDKRIADALARVTNDTKSGSKAPSSKGTKAPARANTSTSTRQHGAVPTQRARIMDLLK